MFVDGYLFSSNLWYIKDITPTFVFKLSITLPKDLLVDINSSINKDSMSFLSIDCSTDIGSLFIKAKNKTFSKFLQSDKFNNDFIMHEILNFFAENNLSFEDISKIFVNQGPGNFSGLRGSLATAKGISLSKNLNLYGYNTFIWLCSKFYKKIDSISCIIKFRDKYFVKNFYKNFLSTSKIDEMTDEEIVKNYNDKFILIPKSMVKYFDSKILKLNSISIVDLDHNELEFLQLNQLLDKDLIKPLYLS